MMPRPVRPFRLSVPDSLDFHGSAVAVFADLPLRVEAARRAFTASTLCPILFCPQRDSR